MAYTYSHINLLVLSRIGEGDETALKVLYHQYYQQLYHISYSIVRSESRSKQALQAIFLDIWQDRETLGGIYNVPAYLHVLLCKHLLDGGTPGEEAALLEAKIVENEEDAQVNEPMLTLSREEADMVYTRISARLHKIDHSSQWKYMLLAVAVTGCIAAGMFWFDGYYKAFHTYKTDAGERKTFILPDGSKVRLNSKSVLRLAGGYGEKNREMELKGEGFFEVKDDSVHSFIVHTVAMDIHDADSAFQIRSYPEEAADITSNITGNANVTLKSKYNNDTLYHLAPRQKLVVTRQPAATDSAVAGLHVESLDSALALDEFE